MDIIGILMRKLGEREGNDPPRALCDGPQSLTPEQFDDVAKRVFAIREAVKSLD